MSALLKQCTICESSTVDYEDSTRRKINVFTSKENTEYIICRGCILKFLIGYVVGINSKDRRLYEQAQTTRTIFKKTQLPPGF
jgi:hypothetical protein